MAQEWFLTKLVRHMHMNNLGVVWYCVLTACLQVYIVVRSINRFTVYVTLPWPNASPPASSINSYMLFTGCTILLLPIFILTALFKIGNYSNDGRKFGSLTLRLPLFEQRIRQGEARPSWCTLLWRHILPIAPTLHLLMSFCFLFPRLITESQLIRHGYLSKADIWKTDLDFLLRSFNGKAFNFLGLIHTINQNEYRNTFLSNSSSGHYFLSESHRMSDKFSELNDSGKLSIEYLNFLLALLILTIRYPAVFWRTNKRFSLVFTSLLLVNAVHTIASWAAFQLTFKLFVCDPTQMLLRYREFSSLSLTQLCLLFFAHLAVVHISSSALYVFGVQKYREYRMARSKQMQHKYEDKLYLSYVPYLMAMVFFLCFSGFLAPVFYEFVIIYCGSLNVNCLGVVFTSIVYVCFWILLWIGVGLKTRWTFEYDDIESSNLVLPPDYGNAFSDCLVIMDQGKTYRIYEDASRRAILSFARSKLHDNDNERNYGVFGRLESPCHLHASRAVSDDRFNRNYRYSTISHKFARKKKSERYNPYDVDDSEGEYTAFHHAKRSNSFRQPKTSLRNMRDQIGADDLYGVISFAPSRTESVKMTNNITYGLGGLGETIHKNPDRVSDTSSGIHSQSSDLSSSPGKSSPIRTDSLESILQRLEAATSEKPCLRSLSPMQKSIHLLNKLDSDSRSTMPKMTSFPSPHESSKLVEFVANNPEYDRFYSMSDRSLV